MDDSRQLECLAHDFARLRSVVASTDLSAPVPSCPGWTVGDLVGHVTVVYLHKVECMRLGAHPENWPPDIPAEDPVVLLDRAYADLAAEFAARPSGSPTFTWFGPDQTVGFWLRRMAQETVIHRVDAELGAGVAIAPIPADLAADGVDELVHAFLEYGSTAWPEEFGLLADADGRGVRVSTGGQSWVIRPTPTGIETKADDIAAEVTGEPSALLLWLWNRAGDAAVSIDGDPVAVTYLKRVLAVGTG
jgi:uncharacterized protein (TIGR03083 family)